MTTKLDQSVVAILTALRVEAEALEGHLTNTEIHFVHGLRFATGEMYGKRCVVVQGGMGKVNAAMTATVLIEHFRPCKVICTGAGGGINPSLLLGDIVIAEKTAQHDYGILTPRGVKPWQTWSPNSRSENPLFLPADDKLLSAAEMAACRVQLPEIRTGEDERIPNIMKGIIVTGDVAVNSQSKRMELRKVFEADAVDMEGAAVAQVCRQMATACLVIRSISDLAENINHDLREKLKVASQNAARFVAAIIDEIER